VTFTSTYVGADKSMRPTGTRAERREATRARIENQAFELLLSEGLDGLKVASLAKRLGYAVGALYRYFPSKQALLLALLGRIVEALDADLDDALSARTDDAAGDVKSLARLLLAARVYASLPERRPAEYRLLALLLGDPRPLLREGDTPPELVQAGAGLFARLGGLFDDAVDAGALGPGFAPLRAVTLFAQLHGSLVLHKLSRFDALPLSPTQVAEEGVQTLLLGYGADADTLRLARELAAT